MRWSHFKTTQKKIYFNSLSCLILKKNYFNIRYVLNTRIDAPHGSHIVTSMVFHSNGNLVVTTGYDKRFRIWKLARAQSVTPTTLASSWSCQSVGFYRECIPRSSAISSDGSLLAVAYAQMITLWNPFTNQLQQTLCHPPPDCPVLKLAFIPKSHFLIATTRSHLYVWNLLTCSVWWMLEIHVACFAVDPFGDRFAVVTPLQKRSKARAKHHQNNRALKQQLLQQLEQQQQQQSTNEQFEEDDVVSIEGKSAVEPFPTIAAEALFRHQLDMLYKDDVVGSEVLLFSPTSPIPLLRHVENKIDCNAIAFVPHLSDKLQLVLTDNISQFIRLEPDRKNNSSTSQNDPLDQVPLGRLSTIFGMLSTTTTKKENASTPVVNPRSMPSALAAPAHVIPAVHRIFDSFMTEVLSITTTNNNNTASDMEIDIQPSRRVTSNTVEEGEEESIDDQHHVQHNKLVTKQTSTISSHADLDSVVAEALARVDFSFLADQFKVAA